MLGNQPRCVLVGVKVVMSNISTQPMTSLEIIRPLETPEPSKCLLPGTTQNTRKRVGAGMVVLNKAGAKPQTMEVSGSNLTVVLLQSGSGPSPSPSPRA